VEKEIRPIFFDYLTNLDHKKLTDKELKDIAEGLKKIASENPLLYNIQE